MSGDAPRVLTRLAVAALPAGRAEWGRAMLGELDHVDGRVARWRFAVGCAGVAARSGSARYVAGACAGMAALVAYGLARWPGILADDPAAGVAHVIVLALLLGAYAVAGVALGGTPGRARSARLGTALGAVAAPLWVGSLAANVLSDPGRLSVAATTAGVAAAAALLFAGVRSGDAAAGVRAGLCGGLVVGLAAFVAVLALTYFATGHLTGDPALAAGFTGSGARDLPTYAVGETMAAAVSQLWLAPVAGAVLGALGGVAAQARR